LPAVFNAVYHGLFANECAHGKGTTSRPVTQGFYPTRDKQRYPVRGHPYRQLPLQYRRDALLPDTDVIFSIKHQYNFYLEQDRSKPQSTVSLSKLFGSTGTDVSLSYDKTASRLTETDESSLQFLISQPIAKNAFGKGYRLRDEIIGIENDVSRHQIVEAYEDYLASLSAAYYNWYSAYENLKVGEASYASNQKLLDNILERQRQKIALPIDVNKMKLLLIGKKENVIVLQEVYDGISNLIFKAIRHKGARPFIPVKPDSPVQDVQFATDYQAFTETSRTYRILRLLEQQGSMEVKKTADDLLPSTNLLLGYQLDGQDWGIREQERTWFAGISLRWPIGRSVDKANYKIAEIQYKKTQLSNQDKYEELHTNLKNLFQQIRREQKLIKVSEKKIQLAESILKDEAENYSFGKVTLNDYLSAVNQLDENRFRYTEHTVQLNKLLVEWLRLTDQLVGEEVLAGVK
jgi:outer membrane protein TolC